MAVLFLLIFVSTYLLLLFALNMMERKAGHSLWLRPLFAVLSWGCLLSFLGYFYSIAAIAYEYLTGDPYAGVRFWGAMTATGMLAYLFTQIEERLNTGEMKNFIRDSLFFANYYRRKDYLIRQELEEKAMADIYKEVTGKKLTADVTATAYDAAIPSRPDTPVKTMTSVIAQTHRDTLAQLRTVSSLDVTEPFRFELLNLDMYYILRMLTHFTIDRSTGELTVHLHLRETPVIDLFVMPVRNRFLGDLYVALLVLLSQKWITEYRKYFQTIALSVFDAYLDDNALLHRRLVATVRWNVQKMTARGSRVTTVDNIKRLADIRFFDVPPHNGNRA